MTRGHRGSLLLRCRAFSSLSSCRFIPAHLTFIFLTPSKLAEIRDKGGEEDAELREYLRSATAWGVLMAGSVLVLAAIVIQLVLACQ